MEIPSLVENSVLPKLGLPRKEANNGTGKLLSFEAERILLLPTKLNPSALLKGGVKWFRSSQSEETTVEKLLNQQKPTIWPGFYMTTF